MIRVRTLAMAVVVFTVAVTTACKPAPPPPTFHVDTFESGPDRDPGDGECRTDADRCTLRAAVEEADALGRGVVLVPGHDTRSYEGFDVTITGSVTVEAHDLGHGTSAYLTGGTITVAQGATLNVEAIEVGGGRLEVHGALFANRLGIPELAVGPTGGAGIFNSVFIPSVEPAIVNEGRVILQYSTIALWSDAGGLVTLDGGETHIAATAVLATDPDHDATCWGRPPLSGGHNAVTNDLCVLDGPGDLEDVEPIPRDTLLPEPGSALIDAIPTGTLGCGTTVVTDARGSAAPRPTDGNHDGTAACDIGAFER